MASEPLFEERSDAVKVCETLCLWLRCQRSRRKGQVGAEPENNSNLCTHPCPYRLARLGTSLRVRGKLTTKEERNYSFYYFIYA